MRLMRAIALFILIGFSDAAVASASAEESQPSCKGRHALYLVIDKSRSMEIDSLLKRTLAAIAAFVPATDEQVSLMVIGFDATPFIVVNEMLMDDAGRELAIQRLKFLMPMGKSNLVTPLALARQRATSSAASCKSLVVISDWKFPLETPEEARRLPIEVKKLVEQGVTISTIVVGEDGDSSLPRVIAKNGNGRFFSHGKPEQIGANLKELLAVGRQNRSTPK